MKSESSLHLHVPLLPMRRSSTPGGHALSVRSVMHPPCTGPSPEGWPRSSARLCAQDVRTRELDGVIAPLLARSQYNLSWTVPGFSHNAGPRHGKPSALEASARVFTRRLRPTLMATPDPVETLMATPNAEMGDEKKNQQHIQRLPPTCRRMRAQGGHLHVLRTTVGLEAWTQPLTGR